MRGKISGMTMGLLAALTLLMSQAGYLTASANGSAQADPVTKPGSKASGQAATPPPAASPVARGDKAGPPSEAHSPSGAHSPSRPQACTPAAAHVPGVDRHGFNLLHDVDATSSADIWAVGAYHNSRSNAVETLIEHWDGSRWAQVPSPNLPGRETYLRSVDAIAPDDAWAVGGSNIRSLATHWDGSGWSIVPTPALTYTGSTYSNSLNAVTAVSSNDVWAGSYVGGVFGEDFILSYELSFLHWDGREWNVVQGVETGGFPKVTDMSAISANDVWAVGYEDSSYYYPSSRPLFLHWDGQVWSRVPGPDGVAYLYGVDAVSANDVWAVGSTAPQDAGGSVAVTMHWDGNKWHRVPGPVSISDPMHNSHLNGVVALSSNDVWAVGYWLTGANTPQAQEHTLTMHWDGTAWSVRDGPDNPLPDSHAPNELSRHRLYAVTGFSGGEAWAVGGQGTPQTLIERWDGAEWNIVPSVDPGLAYNVLLDIDASSPDDIWAVGNYDVALPYLRYTSSLVEHWDGSRWSVVPSPNVTTSENRLHGVEAISPTDVWAVGIMGVGGSGDYSTLTMHWNGEEWSIIPSPDATETGRGDNSLSDVAAASPDDVWAVGSAYPLSNTPNRGIIEHWNGEEWSLVPPPDTGDEDVSLTSVAVIASDDVWAVGTIGQGPLALHWNGTEWSVAPMPEIEGVWLFDVAAVSSDDVWAVGMATDRTAGTSRTLTIHWDGSNWSEVHSPNMPGASGMLVGISASSPDNVWAVGNFDRTDSRQAMLMRWDGTAWQFVQVPDPGTPHTALWGVVALSPTDVWAAGNYGHGNDSLTLVEHVGYFSDVAPTDYYYAATSYLAERGVVSGYADNCAFRPANNTSRGQVAKIVALAEGWQPLDPHGPTFADVPPGSPFYGYIEAAASRHIIGGYPCGNPEPCDEQQRPYFRPGKEVTRGQLAKIVVLAEGWETVEPGSATFADVPTDAPFYPYVETAYSRGILGGYRCGSPEPCDAADRPYFRPGSPATRGQVAKLVYNAVTSP